MDIPKSFTDYDIEADVEAFERALSVYNKLSEATFARTTWQRDLNYGEHPDERLDIASPEDGSDRIVIYFHGGWWRSGRKEGRAFLAEEFLQLGYHFVNVEYPLAPQASLPDIVASAERAVGYVYKMFVDQGRKPRSLVITGNSAGGHLAACVCSNEALARISVPSDVVTSVLSVSGIFDLRPLMDLPPNGWLKLNDETARDFSPIELSYPPTLKVRLVVGGAEPKGFAEQTDAFESLLKRRGMDVRSHLEPGHDHMQIIARIPHLFDQMR